MLKRRLVLIFLVALIFSPPTIAADHRQAQVTRVVDGDTIEVRLPEEKTEKVRYIGMNTPETHGGVEYFGREASEYNKALVADQTVWLEFDGEKRDKYCRGL